MDLTDMRNRALHQVCVAAVPGDAITDQAFMLRRWLLEMGFVSEIFAEYVDPALEHDVRPFQSYRPRSYEKVVIYHHGVGSPVVDRLTAMPLRLVVIYHNVTPPEFFATVDPELTRQMILGRQQLGPLSRHSVLACGVSPYNVEELSRCGFANTAVLPLALSEAEYNVEPDPRVAERHKGRGPILLFVGRTVPNKKQEDLIRLLYLYLRIRPTAQLILVGSDWLPSYGNWLRCLVEDFGLKDAVTFTGYVTHRELVSYYRLADLYVSMSEHEGFGKPFIESMYLGLPIMAYAAAGVPHTLGHASILFRRKEFEVLAEFVDILMNDEPLRERIIARQRRRVQAFLEPYVRESWNAILNGILQ